MYGVHIPRKCIGSRHFYSCPRSPLRTPGRIENLFPPTAKRGGESHDLLYQNSITNYEDGLEY